MSGRLVFKLFGLILVISRGISNAYTYDRNRCNGEPLKLTMRNSGDIYLIIEEIAALTAAEAFTRNRALNTDTPLGLLASHYAIGAFDNTTLFAVNTLNNQLKVAMNSYKFDLYIAKFYAVLREHRTSFESVFNELLGYSVPITLATYEVFRQFGNIFAENLGIGLCEATFMTNLNAFVPIALVLPRLPFYKSVKRQLKSLAYIRNIQDLPQALARTSVILDAYGQCNNIVEFSDIYPIQTKSGYEISTLIGQTHLITKVIKGFFGRPLGCIRVDYYY